MPLLCPLDSTELLTEQFKGIDLDICPSCKGIWFNEDELRELLALDPEALADLGHFRVPDVGQRRVGPSDLRCPYDHAHLVQFHYLLDSPVILEKCDQCGGFWVRNDELEKMQQLLDEVRRPSPNEAGLAEDLAAHAAFMARQQNMAGFFTMLRTISPGWFI